VEGLGLGPGREFDLIRGFFERTGVAASPQVRVGPGDDCAVVVGDGIALSCDLSVEGVHFRREWLTEREIGYRAAAAALSDLAAVAARPIGVLVALAVPETDAGEPITRVMEGVSAAATRVGAAVLGGDLTRSPAPLVLDLTVVGETAAPVLRSGARPGDSLWVTGELGGAAAAVAAWLAGVEPEPEARRRFAAPEPRTREARWLAEHGLPHALIDLSDGLAGDAAHIAAASRVAVVVAGDAVPIHPALRRLASTPEEALRLALGGGEDYELCFTAGAGQVEARVAAFHREFGLRLTRVGYVEPGEGVFLEHGSLGRQPLRVAGFQHFGGSR
jgi:thiamine-monophosphate kinase